MEGSIHPHTAETICPRSFRASKELLLLPSFDQAMIGSRKGNRAGHKGRSSGYGCKPNSPDKVRFQGIRYLRVAGREKNGTSCGLTRLPSAGRCTSVKAKVP